MVYLVNQKRKKNKNEKKNSETQNKSDYEIIQKPIILLSDIFCQFWPYDLSWEFKNNERIQVTL